ncbi:MAG: hypothetical protein ACMX3H_03420, partial [Sodalis sp. (in: enterobacteria)]
MAADGNIYGSQWGNQGLDAYLRNTFQPKGAYSKTNTAKREVNGWWKCGDTGLIIQWGIYGKGQVGTYDFPLPIRFPKAGLFCIGYAGAAIAYDEDRASNSAHLVDNATVRVTVDGGPETVVLAIGF